MDEASKGLFDFADDATDLGGESIVPDSANYTTYKLCETCWILCPVAYHTITFVVQTISGSYPVTVHESMVTSVHKRMEPRRSLLGASVDVTDALLPERQLLSSERRANDGVTHF